MGSAQNLYFNMRDSIFLWLKALHLMFMVAWFAGLFYLPRLFVYHAQTADAEGNARFKIMERKLFWGIMTPGAILTIVFGLCMLSPTWGIGMPVWLGIKLFVIALLAAFHIWCLSLLRAFDNDANTHSHVWYRWFNEIPTVALIVIIWLAVLRPF